MDLVDIDKVLDDLEYQESQTSSVASRNDKEQPSRMHSSSNSPPSSNRRIKVRSVLSSLNDYVEYDRKQPVSTSSSSQQKPTSSPCEQTAAAAGPHDDAVVANKAGVINYSKADNEQPEAKLSVEPRPHPEPQIVRHPTPVTVTPQSSKEEEKELSDVPADDESNHQLNQDNSDDTLPLSAALPPDPSPPPTAPAQVISEQSCIASESSSAPHVTPSSLPAPITDDQQTQQSETNEQTNSAPSTTVGLNSIVPEDEEEDLEKYLDDLVTEYDNQVNVRGKEAEQEKPEVKPQLARSAIEGKEVEKAEPAAMSTEQMENSCPTAAAASCDAIGSVVEQVCGEETKVRVSATPETPRESLPVAPDAPSEELMNMDELRELERLIQQQEREEQMELDRQMAMKLQEDDEELLQTIADTARATPASDSPAIEAPPPPAEEASEPGSSPLEAPRSASVRVMDDDPEYRYLIALGKVAPYWVPDTTHDTCMQCDQKFSLLKRRHHCRCCGELLCATCCSFRAHLEYMREQQQLVAASTSSASSASTAQDWPEARICTKCDKLVQRRDELLQLRYLAECGIGEDSGLAEFPIKGVLKKPKVKPASGESSGGGGGDEDDDDEATTTDNSDSTATPTKTVIFSDGIRPGHDDFNEEGGRTRRRSKSKPASTPITPAAAEATPPAQEVQSPIESEVVARALNSYKAFVTALKTFYNPQNQSYLPPIKTHLPPLLKSCGGFLPVIELQNNFSTCQELCDYLKSERREFLVQKRLHCSVQIIDYRVDANQMDNQCRWCLNVTTNGMGLLGQQEFVILVEMNPQYFTVAAMQDDKRNLKFLLLLLRRLFVHFNKIYSRIHAELAVEMRAKRKLEVAQLQHPDPSLLLLDNRVLVAPFAYFNKTYSPQLGGKATAEATDTNGNESDESENGYICDKYTFLKPKTRYVHHMDLQRVTFGTKGDPDFYLDFNAILYVRAMFQSTQNVLMPERRGCGGDDVLFGLLVKQTEIPWAKLFPLRLLIRLGAEYRMYPWPLFNALDRQCLYSEFVDNSIIHFLADFRNFSYTLNEVPGLHMHMEHEQLIPSLPDAEKEENVRVKVFLPKINYKRIEAMVNDSSESILSFSGALNKRADGHLVCIQQNGEGNKGNGGGSGSSAYSTQSLNIEREATAEVQGPSKTGLNFFILNGALKSATGLKAKLSIIEDGVMVQVLPGIMAKVRSALLEMRNIEIRCEESDDKVGNNGGAVSEVIEFIWISAPVIESISGLKSEIDERSLENCSYVNVLCDYHKRPDGGKPGQSSSRGGIFGMRSGNSRLEMDCFYLHLHKVVLFEEENFFSLFNEKMLHMLAAAEGGDEHAVEGGAGGVTATTDGNANLIKSLNVSNWEVPSINFLIKMAAMLGRIVDRALSKHYSRLHDEKLRRIGVRFNFQPDHIVTYEAGSCGTKLPMVFMNDLDTQLIPLLHHILELNAKDTPSVLPFNKNVSAGNGGVGHNLNAEFLDRISLLQNLQRGITFELVFDIVIDLP